MSTASGRRRAVSPPSARRSKFLTGMMATVAACAVATTSVLAHASTRSASTERDLFVLPLEQPQNDDVRRAASGIVVDRTSLDEAVATSLGNDLAVMRWGMYPLMSVAQEPMTPLRASTLEATDVVSSLAGGELDLPGGILLSHPVSSTRISSPFGMRKNPTGAGYQFHVGQDYPVPLGTPVRAAADGTVIFAGWHVTGGMRVEIDHGHGVVTAYSHNSSLGVRVGQTIEAGQLISLAGSTGNSTGPHVHFEVKVAGQWVNPALYLPRLANQPRSLTAAEAEGLYQVAGQSPAAAPSGPASTSPSENTSTPSTTPSGTPVSPTTPETPGTGSPSAPSTPSTSPSTPSTPSTAPSTEPSTPTVPSATPSTAPSAPSTPNTEPSTPSAPSAPSTPDLPSGSADAGSVSPSVTPTED